FKWFKKEPFIPSLVIDRRDRNSWENEGSKDIFQRAQERVKEIKETHVPVPLGDAQNAQLDQVTKQIMQELGVDKLPWGPQ
ncbi:MAG TPA: hypothetical protein VLH18_02955, partial [Candidatus Limnocylindrales bacterium]|nr:hypothetical protein [Candidatus Limnocylindrales bacterium]